MSAASDSAVRHLHIEIPGEDAYAVELAPGRYVIGRSAKAEVQVDFGRVSSQHCVIEYGDGSWWISDLGSRNGTTIGDAEEVDLTETAAPLEHGDVIGLGRTVRIEFIDPDAPEEPEVPAHPASASEVPEAVPQETEDEKLSSNLLSWTWTIWFGSGILLAAWAILIALESWIRA